MFGYVSKNKLLKKMEELKKGGSLKSKYPPQTKEDEARNIFAHGYESGSDNFYNGLLSWLKKQ